jgi:hypothetical protein
MKVKLLTLCSDDCRELGDLTGRIKKEFAERHGYEFVEKKHDWKLSIPSLGHHHLVFERWLFLFEELQSSDVCLMTGADVLFTNHTITVESLMKDRKPFIIAKDALGFQSDVIIATKTDKTLELIKSVYNSYTTHRDAPFLDQSAFADHYKNFEQVIEVVPQRLINSFHYWTLKAWFSVHDNYAKGIDESGNDGQWRVGDFALHLPGISFAERISLVKSHIPLIVR